jgi:hypothetical protein
MVACQAAIGTPGNESETLAANNLLAEIFPDVYGQYVDNGNTIGNCSQGKAFFLTYPKQKFTDDCKRPSDNSYCTETLNQFSPVLVIKGNRPEGPVEFSNSNLAPRFNISWDPWSNGKTKIFASWGRFFDKTNLAVVTLEQGPDTRSRDFIFNTSLGTTTSAGNVASDPDVTLVDRTLSTEFKDEWTVGFEREIAPETKIRLTYIANKFRNQYQDVDFNHYVRDVGPEFIAPVRRTVGGSSGRIVGYVPMGGEAICDFDPVVTGLAPTAQIVGAVENGSIQKTGEYNQPNGKGDDCFGFVANKNGNLQPISDGLPDLFRRNLLYNNILFLSNLNRSEFNGFTLEFIRRLKRNWQLTAGWTHGTSLGAADNFQDESGNDPSLVDDEFGYTGFDIRNVVTVSVTTILPWGDLRLGSVITYISGTPFSIRERESAYDAANQSTFRTVFPTGSRNDQRNDSYQQIDVTLEKAFLIKKYNATAQILIANLLGDDFLTVANFVDGRIQAARAFGRFFELRFTINF